MNRIIRFILFAASILVPSLVAANEHVVTNLIYSEKGLAGKQVMTKVSDNEYLGLLDIR